MKVVLISFPHELDVERDIKEERVRSSVHVRFFPEGIAYIASSLAISGHEVEIVDLAMEGSLEKRFSLLEEADVFGLSGLISHFAQIESTVHFLRMINPKAKIVLGGPLITADPYLIARNLDFDFGVIGEGEETIIDLLDNLDDSGKVPGLAIRSNERDCVVTEKRPFLFCLRRPALEKFDLKWYLGGEKRLHYKRLGIGEFALNNIMVSRGCPYDCNFCGQPFGRRLRYHSVQNIDFILDSWIRAGARTIRFQDDNIDLMPESVEEFLLPLLAEKELGWIGHARIDNVSRLRVKLSRMAKAGLKMIYLGVESFSQDALNGSFKGTKVEQEKEAIEVAREAGIIPAGFFALGLPGETKESLKSLVEFIEDEKLTLMVALLIPIPGTPIYHEAKKRGQIKNELELLRSFDGWERKQREAGRLFINLTGLPDKAIFEAYDRLNNLGNTA